MLTMVDYLFIIVYLLGIAIVGLLSLKFARSKEDFLVAGRRLSLPIFFSCMAALALGGGSTVGSVRLGYEFGVGGIWLNLSIGIGLIVTGLLVSSKLAKLKALSINEIVEENYGYVAKLFSTLLTLIYTITLSVVQVIAIGEIISGTLQTNFTLSMVAGGGIVIIYTFIGGMWSVTLTDVIQFAIKTVGFIILAPVFSISAVGGWDVFVNNLPPSHFSITSIGIEDIVLYLVLYVPGIIIGQDIWQRIFTAKNNYVARAGTLCAGIYSIVYAFATVIIGMCVCIMQPSLSDPQNAFVQGVIDFLPSGIKGIVLAAAMAATMSVASGTILASSTILYNDIYHSYLDKEPTEKKAIWATRLFAAIIGIVVMICALWIRDVLVGIKICYGYLSGCVFIPLLASFILTRFSPKAGLWSLGGSFVVVTFLFIHLGTSSVFPILYGMLSGLIIYVAINIASKHKTKSRFYQSDQAVEPNESSSPVEH